MGPMGHPGHAQLPKSGGRRRNSITTAQVKRLAVAENGDGPAARDIRALWQRVKNEIA
jgi:hypothetical protein